MPQIESVHVKKSLGNVATAYFQSPDVFIADLASPHVRVPKESDFYWIFGREHFNVVDAIRRPGTTPVEVEHTVSTDQFFCQEYSLREKITDEERENADAPIDPEIDAVRYTSERLRLSRELRIATTLTTAGNYQTGMKVTLGGGDQWNLGTSSDPITVIQTAVDAVAARGKQPNTMFMGHEVWSKLKHHPDLIARLTDTRTRIVTRDLLKAIWEEIDTVLVGSAIYNSAVEGQDESLAYCWGKYFGVAYINRAMPNKKVPSFNYSFVWPYTITQGRVRRDAQPGGTRGTVYQGRVYRHADEGARSDWAEVAFRVAFKITGDYMGYLISGAVA